MEECVRRNEAEGKEINPVTCTFIKKCKEGEVRNDKGRCVKAKTKTKQNTPNVVPFAPFVYRRKPYAPQKIVTINKKRAKEIKRNATHNKNHYRTTGRPGRVSHTAKLLPPHNVNTAVRGKTTVRNSRNLSYLNNLRLQIEPIEELEEELGEETNPSSRNSRLLQKRKSANKRAKKLEEELAKENKPAKNSRLSKLRRKQIQENKEREEAAARQRLQQGDTPDNSPEVAPVAPGIRI